VWLAISALITVYCTAMIYRSLAPIRQWSNATTVPVYLGFSVMTGSTWLHALTTIFGVGDTRMRLITGAIAVIAIPAVYTIKRAAWRTAESGAISATAASATGLSGEIKSVEWPHTEANYLLKEMGYVVARKHAARLRAIATAAAFFIPEVLLVVTLGHGGLIAAAATLLAALVMALGTVVERWLFFAEARHTVTLYYGVAPA